MASAPVTVIIPTHDHAFSLEFSVGSVLEQTHADLDLVVIGDGIGDDTRDALAPFLDDARVTVWDRPKGPRHNERVRHEVIGAVDSPVIVYCGDDDILLPRHLETMVGLLADHDFAHPLPLFVEPDGSGTHLATDLSRPECVTWHLGDVQRNAVSLTGAAHTRESYLRLPIGWRETPKGRPTDHYMWQQYFALDGLRAVTSTEATTIKLAAEDRTSSSIADRAAELRHWWDSMHAPGFDEEWHALVDAAVRRTAVDTTLAFSAAQDLLDGTVEELRALHTSADDAGRALKDVAAEVDRLHKAVADVVHERDAARTALAAARGQLTRTVEAHDAATARLATAEARVSAALTERDLARTERDALRRTLSWRVTRPLRALRRLGR